MQEFLRDDDVDQAVREAIEGRRGIWARDRRLRGRRPCDRLRRADDAEEEDPPTLVDAMSNLDDGGLTGADPRQDAPTRARGRRGSEAAEIAACMRRPDGAGDNWAGSTARPRSRLVFRTRSGARSAETGAVTLCLNDRTPHFW